jgi:Flp pilus assembly pilin Flp
MRTTLRRFVFDDRGQDLIEYALLSALIGVVGILAWTNVGGAINTTYTAWDTDVQGLSATTPDPISAGS